MNQEIETLINHIESLQRCCLSDDIPLDNIVKVYINDPAPQEDSGLVMFGYENGKVGIVWDAQDYSGHG